MISKLRLKSYKVYYLKKKFIIWKRGLNRALAEKKRFVTVKKEVSLESKTDLNYYFFSFLSEIKSYYFSYNNFILLNLLKKLTLRVFKNGNNINFFNTMFKAFFYISKKNNIPLKIILLFIFAKVENPLILKIFFLRKTKILMPIPNLDLNKSLREGISWFKKSLSLRRERTIYLRLIAELSELLSNKGFILSEKKKYISSMLLSAAQNRRYQKFLLKNVI